MKKGKKESIMRDQSRHEESKYGREGKSERKCKLKAKIRKIYY